MEAAELLVKPVAGFGMIGGSGWGEGLEPVGMIDGVGVVLGLQSDSAALAVVDAALAGILQEVACVELDAGQIGEDIHGAAGDGIVEGGAGIAEDLKVVVVAALEVQRFVVGFNIPADGFGGTEVHGSTLYAAGLTGGDAFSVGGGEETGGQGQDLIHGGIGFIVAGQVKVTVVGQVENSILVTDAVIGDAQGIVGADGIGDGDGGVAGVTLVAVGAEQAE